MNLLIPQSTNDPKSSSPSLLSSPNDLFKLDEFDKERQRKEDEARDCASRGHGQIYGKCGHRICGCRCTCGVKFTLDMLCRDCREKDKSMEPTPAMSVGSVEVGNDPGLGPGAISIMITPVEEPTLPVTPEWGLPAGPLPLIIKERPNPVKDWICPHCHETIHEEGTYYNSDTKNEYHRKCGGEYIRPAPSVEQQIAIQAMQQMFGLREGLLREDVSSEYPVIVRTDKPAVMVCNAALTEAMAKSVEERIHRRTRKVHEAEGKHPEPVIKKTANNDPRKTSRGRRNFRGTRKASQDAKKRRNPEPYTESADFIRMTYNRSADIILEHAARLSDPLVTLECLSRLKSDKINNSWVEGTKRAIITLLEGRGFRKGPYLGVVGLPQSMAATKMTLTEDFNRVKQYFPDAWIEKKTDAKGTIVRYRIIGQRDEKYDSAVQNDMVETV